MGRETKINIVASLRSKLIALLSAGLLGFALPAAASYIPFNTNTNMNVGIATSTPQGAFVVTNGNIGIGTWAPVNTLAVAGNETIGLGAGYLSPTNTAPSNGLIVQGNVGLGTFYTGSNNLTIGTYGSTVPGGTVGIGTSSTANSILVNTNRYSLEIDGQYGLMGVFSNSTGRAGIIEYGAGAGPSVFGFTGYNGSDMAVMAEQFGRNLLLGTNTTEIMRITYGGNVGIGTSTPVAELGIVGNVGIGTGINSPYVTTIPPPGGMIVQGNVGIGSLAPGQSLDVQGTVRMKGLTLTGNGAANGNVLVGNGVGVGTWMPLSALGASSSNYWLLNGGAGNIGINTSYAVGIGTSFVGGTGEAALAVMNGNVGIGTWVPLDMFQVGRYKSSSGGFEVDSNGNVGIGTTNTSNNSLTVLYGNVGIGTTNALDAFTIYRGTTNVMTQIDDSGINFTRSFDGFIGGYLNYIDGAGIVLGTDGDIVLFPNNRNALLAANVDNIGKVRIGDVDPVTGGARLEVQGSLAVGSIYASATSVPTDGMVVQGNVGIGTSVPAGTLDVEGTLNPVVFNAVAGNLNVGIGSFTPGQKLDVKGTARMTGFTLTGNGAAAGNVLVGNGVGVGTWMPAGTLATTSGSNYWLNDTAGNVGISTAYAVGIGTTFVGGTGEAALSVMNGNVGIGTWVPNAVLNINSVFSVSPSLTIYESGGGGNILQIDNGGRLIYGPNSNFGGTSAINFGNNLSENDTTTFFKINPASGNLGNLFQILKGATSEVVVDTNGNVGIGSLSPGQALDVTGTARMTGFILTGNGAAAGNVLVGNGVGIGTWMPASTLATSAGTNYWLNDTAGNVGISTFYAVGIGTTFVGGTNEAAFSIMKGNVGIGTWIPNGNNNGGLLDIGNATTGDIEIDNTGDMTIGGQLSVNGQGIFADGTISTQGFFTSTAPAIQGASGGGDADFLLTNGGSAGLPANSSGAGLQIEGAFTTAGGGTHPLIAGAAIFPMAITSGGASITNTAALYIDSAGSATVTGQKFALWVNSGISDFGGNVGISSTAPGQLLDVQGTIRTKGLTLTGNGAAAGNVLVGNGVGVGTWMPANTLASSNFWLNNGGGNIGISTAYAVGIGTSFIGGTGEASFAVMNGNMGIGTWVPAKPFSVTGDAFLKGNIGIGTTFVGGANESALTVMNGNVGIGTWLPGTALSVYGSGPAHFGPPSGIVSQNGISLFADGILNNPIISSSTLEAIATGGSSPTIFRWGPVYVNGSSISGYLGYSGGAPYPDINLTSANADLYLGTGTSATDIVVKDISGNVGIGSLSPGQTLDVQGTVRAIGFTMSGQTPISGYVMTSLDSVGDVTWSSPGAVGGWTVSGNNVYETSNGNVGIGTTNPFGGNLIVNGGSNVGIGTLVPGQLLDVKGTVRFLGEIVNGNVGIGTAALQAAFAVANGNVGIGTWTAGGGNLIIKGGGNVGIGSAWPGQMLDVQGTVRDLGEIVNGNIGIGTNTPQSGLVIPFSNVGIGTWTAANDLSVVGQIAIGSTIYANAPAPNLGMIVQGNVGIGTLTAAGGNLIVNGGGNVGISSAWPGTALDVSGTARMTGFILTGNGAAPGSVMITNSIGVGTWMPINTIAAGGVVNSQVANEVAYYNSPSPTQTLIGSASMIFNSGNLGLGTVTPVATLSVVGNIGIGTVKNGDNYINTIPPNGGVIVEGNVGIGTWAPTKPFSVTGDSYLNGNIGIGTTFIAGTGESSFTVMNGNVGIGTWAGGGAMVVMNGNVGIGTTTPTYQLAVGNNAFIKTATLNKSTFMEVSYGTGAGASNNFNFTNAFKKINFHSLTGYTLNDPGGNYDTTNDWYVTPVAGTYMIITKLRVTDSQTQFISYGQGSGTSAADSPTFLWCQTATTTATRNGSQNSVMKHYTAGSDVEMFAYANSSINSSDGDFSIFLLTAD